MMIILAEQPDSFLSGAEAALELRKNQLEPAIKKCEIIQIDFANVRGTSQSWMNAFLMGTLLECGVDKLKYLKFQNCNSLVKEMITFAVQKAQQRLLQAA
jgi:hypothetical protein